VESLSGERILRRQPTDQGNAEDRYAWQGLGTFRIGSNWFTRLRSARGEGMTLGIEPRLTLRGIKKEPQPCG
jgi:hypothetical protein